MSHFDARMRLPGQTRLPVNIVVDITDDRIRFVKDGNALGDWSLEEIEVGIRADGIYVKVDHEEIALSVTDADGFAKALKTARHTTKVADETAAGEAPVPAEAGEQGNGLADRIRRIDPEIQFEEMRHRITELAKEMTDESVSPPEVFARWLRLLKELNVRHGQGAMPTSIFYRLNTELLDLMPVPKREPNPELQQAGPGPRL